MSVVTAYMQVLGYLAGVHGPCVAIPGTSKRKEEGT
jgi:hypothetical protein